MAQIKFSDGPFRHTPWIVSSLVLLYLLLTNMWTYSALGDHRIIGKHFRAAVADDAPVIATYLLAGDLIRKAMPSLGMEAADAAAAPLVERITGYPPAAVAVFFGDPMSSEQSRMQWQHRLLPFAIVLTLILWVRRPQNIHLVRQTRHR